MEERALLRSNKDVIKRKIVGETILLDIKRNRMLLLNKQAEVIWDQIKDSEFCREADILKLLQYRYPKTSIITLQTDVDKFLQDLHNRGFIYKESQHAIKQIDFDYRELDASGHFSFSERLHNLAVQQNVPISGCIEITQRCHHKCIHCYIDDKPINHKDELTTEELIDLLEQMAIAGCLWLLITGGEPLLRRDFKEIYKCAKELGMIITVFTSATNLTERIVDLFIEYPPFLVESTLHGATEKTFDIVSGIRESFQKFRQGINMLKEGGILFNLKMIVMQQNVREVKSAYELALEMGAKDFRFDPMINADFFHSPRVKDLRITVEEAVKLDLMDPFKNRWKSIYNSALEKRNEYKVSNKLLFPCKAGKCSFAISADGKLLPCILMRFPEYDLRKMKFFNAWEKLSKHTTNIRISRNNLCLECSVQTCSKCPAWGYLEHQDPNSKSQFACSLELEREKIFLQ